MAKTLNVAIVGATGLVGETFLEVLEERNFPIDNLVLLASEQSAGKRLSYQGISHTVKNLANYDFTGIDLAFFSAGKEISEKYAPIATEAGAIVIDNTSAFRYDDDVPLIVPEVNPDAVEGYKARGIIANPNCSTIQMLVALKPLHDAAGIKKINVATYQAVSGTGKEAVSELAGQTVKLLNVQPVSNRVYKKQIAFNVIPHIDDFLENGFTREEMKMHWETQKIMDKTIVVNATTVRVPVFFGHSEAVHVEFKREIKPSEAISLLQNATGVYLFDGEDYPTAVTDSVGKDGVFVGRVRQGMDDLCGLNLWIVADNVRKGAATNSVQIAELLIEKNLL